MKIVLILMGVVLTVPLCSATKTPETPSAVAFTKAKREKKPLMLVFHAVWCPDCNHLEESVFQTREFLEAAKNYVVLNVDADSAANWPLKEKYKIGGYPTVLFANSKGEEIYRFLGARTTPQVTSLMRAFAKAPSFEKSCEKNDTESLWRCLVVCQERSEGACVEKTLAQLQSRVLKDSTRYWEVRNIAVETEKNDELKRNGYLSLMKERADYPRAVFWAINYWQGAPAASIDEATKTLALSIAEKAANVRPSLLLEEVGISSTDVAVGRAELLELLGKEDEAKKAWFDVVTQLNALLASAPHAPRGVALEKIGCLERAGDLEGALKLSQDFIQKYPQEFTFYYRAASVLKKAKKYPEAIQSAERAFALSYGDNRIRSASLLLALYAPLSQKDSGKKIYDEVKKEFAGLKTVPPRTQRYLTALDEGYKRLAAAK